MIDVRVENGKVTAGADQPIAPDDTDVLTIKRDDLNKPLTMVVIIDGKASEITNFPAVPQYKLDFTSKGAETERHERGGRAGTQGISTDIHCIDSDSNSIFLSESAKVTIVGGGLEWNTRTGSEITLNTPKKICFRAMSYGDTCPDAKCTYYYKGVLSVQQATIKKLVD